MGTRADSWAGRLSEGQIEDAYAIALRHSPRHAALSELCETFGIAKRPSKTAFYRWLATTEKEAWRWRLKHAVSVARTMEAALPDEADALYRNSLVALGVDAAVQQDPKIAIAIGKTLSAMNKDREARLTAQIDELKARIETILADQQKAEQPLDPARLAAAVDEVLGRKKLEVRSQKSEVQENNNASSTATH
jgi:hypothetical protein